MKSLTSAGVILGLLVSTIAGLNIREKRDMPESAGTGLLASKDVQFDIAESDYYAGISNLLKEKYVDPITDNKKLLSGAVRGMVMGLNDINSQFYNPNEFAAYKNARAGQYHGVGVWLDFKSVKTDIKAAPALLEQAKVTSPSALSISSQSFFLQPPASGLQSFLDFSQTFLAAHATAAPPVPALFSDPP